MNLKYFLSNSLLIRPVRGRMNLKYFLSKFFIDSSVRGGE